MREKPKLPGSLRTFLILLLALLILGWLFFYLRELNPWFLFDYIEYWSASFLLLRGQNPYDPGALLAVQQALGFNDTQPVMMWNPPWVAPVVLPLALLDYASSRTLWFFLQLCVLIYCALALWKMYAGMRQHGKLFTILAATLTGAVFWMLFFGQVSFFVLLGATGFLILIQRQTFRSDLLAGLAAGLIAVKPQVFFLFWPALLIWSVSTRRKGAVLGSLLVLCGGVLVGSALVPGLLAGYVSAVLAAPPTYWSTPTLGYWLRAWLGSQYAWLQFLPSLLGLAWTCVFAWQRRGDWQWTKEMPLLILVSLVTSAHTWTHDQVVFVIPVIALAAALLVNNRRRALAVLGSLWLALNLIHVGGRFFYQEHYFVWLAPLLLLVYIIFNRLAAPPNPQQP